jgi:hypothetical protein
VRSLDDRTPLAWYEDGPGLEWWWAIEHRGHPFAFLRSLMPGDFAPGRLPLPRHLMKYGGPLWPPPADSVCPCGETPSSDDLVVIERESGDRSFIAKLRARGRWPDATDPSRCWECGSRDRPAAHDVFGLRVCRDCVSVVLRKVRN